MPVSITPGEKTNHGFGAELALTVEHEFPADFLQSSFRNLVINDLVDRLGPVVYEVLRSGAYDKFERYHDVKARYDDGMERILPPIRRALEDYLKGIKAQSGGSLAGPGSLNRLADFILVGVDTNPPMTQADRLGKLTPRFDALKDVFDRLVAPAGSLSGSDVAQIKADLDDIEQKRRQNIKDGIPVDRDRDGVRLYLNSVLTGLSSIKAADAAPSTTGAVNDEMLDVFSDFFVDLNDTVVGDEGRVLVDVFKMSEDKRSEIHTLSLELDELSANLDNLRLSLPSTRNPKQRYPITAQEAPAFFLEENIYILAKDARESSITKTPRFTDIRNHLRHSLQVAYNAMSKSQPGSGAIAPLDNFALMNQIDEAVKAREFGPDNKLGDLFKKLAGEVKKGRKNVYDRNPETHHPIAALAWAIAVDSVLLDDAFRSVIPKVFAAHDFADPVTPDMHFYFHDDGLAAAAKPVFNEFVKYRWPIVTFALDPVAEQQNVADSFNLQRDLQLALSYAFATGQINFGQLNTFRRQIQQSSDTIALNRTVTGFIHGNDTFGFRFTPRFQNPPMQRTNLGVIASQLIGGGPGPDYGTKKSKLEPGMRELTAVLLVPTFLPTMRMEVSSNWFRLHDPEHLVFHTKRMLERGREVKELRQAVRDTCSERLYRDADLRVLQAKLSQLEAMLPSQSKVVQLPYENTASGFDLFADGSTALVPELSGYEGIDVVKPPGQGAANAGDIFVYGKYIDLLDTKVIVGGAYVPPIATTALPTAGGYEILSREVVHVQIPANVQQTVTFDDKTYLEVYLATPSGISNRVLVPFQAVAPTPQVAYDLGPDSQSLDVFYQWFPKADANATLVATDDPGAKGLKITWDAPTGMAPKTLLATFTGTVGGQSLIFSLPANSGVKDEYVVDKQLATVIILKRLQSMFPAPTALPTTPFTLKVSVQPYLPQGSMGYRVLSKAKDLKTPLTVKLVYNATDKDALPGLTEPPPPPKPSALMDKEGVIEEPVRRASLQAPIPAPFGTTSPALPTTAQALAGALPPLAGNLTATASSAVANLAPGAAVPDPAQLQALLPPLPPTIIVNPSPVTVIAPSPAPTQRSSRLSKLFDHKKKGAPATAR